MKIRKATKKDLKEIAEIFRIETAKKPYFQDWTKKTAFDKISNSLKEEEMYVIMVDNKLVGFVTLKPDNKNKEVYVDELWLKLDYQGKGLGKALINFIEKEARKEGMKKIILMANQKAGAVKFYEKLNYKEKHRFVYFVKELKK